MNILITGGAGYLGSVIVRRLLKNHNVTVVDNLMYNQTSYKLLVQQVSRHDVIIPLAALVGFPSCENDKKLATDVNYHQIKDVVDNISNNQMILFPNTNSGYGSRVDGMVDETNSLTPISHYGVTKCDAENYIKHHTNGIIFRLATVFGVSSRMRLDLLVNEFVYKLLTEIYYFV